MHRQEGDLKMEVMWPQAKEAGGHQKSQRRNPIRAPGGSVVLP